MSAEPARHQEDDDARSDQAEGAGNTRLANCTERTNCAGATHTSNPPRSRTEGPQGTNPAGRNGGPASMGRTGSAKRRTGGRTSTKRHNAVDTGKETARRRNVKRTTGAAKETKTRPL